MEIRQVNVSDSDRLSAKLFFDALAGFYPMENMRVLDAFARNGQLTVSSYYKHIQPSNLSLWELSGEHEQVLRTFSEDVRIGCSYDHAAKALARGERYDMVVVDTPQGVHGRADGQSSAEHFGFLPLALRLLKKTGVVVLYCNKEPYDKNEEGEHGYDTYKEYDFAGWMRARGWFYEALNPRSVSEVEMLRAYRKRAADYGYEVIRMLVVPCFSDVPGKQPYAFRLALEVARIGE